MLDPSDHLEDAARIFRERNAVYQDGYKQVGNVLMALFPEGIPACGTAREAERLAHFIMVVTKVHRYASNLHKGGHSDSARDLMVYAAFLRSATDEP